MGVFDNVGNQMGRQVQNDAARGLGGLIRGGINKAVQTVTGGVTGAIGGVINPNNPAEVAAERQMAATANNLQQRGIKEPLTVIQQLDASVPIQSRAGSRNVSPEVKDKLVAANLSKVTGLEAGVATGAVATYRQNPNIKPAELNAAIARLQEPARGATSAPPATSSAPLPEGAADVQRRFGDKPSVETLAAAVKKGEVKADVVEDMINDPRGLVKLPDASTIAKQKPAPVVDAVIKPVETSVLPAGGADIAGKAKGAFDDVKSGIGGFLNKIKNATPAPTSAPGGMDGPGN